MTLNASLRAVIAACDDLSRTLERGDFGAVRDRIEAIESAMWSHIWFQNIELCKLRREAEELPRWLGWTLRRRVNALAASADRLTRQANDLRLLREVFTIEAVKGLDPVNSFDTVNTLQGKVIGQGKACDRWGIGSGDASVR